MTLDLAIHLHCSPTDLDAFEGDRLGALVDRMNVAAKAKGTN